MKAVLRRLVALALLVGAVFAGGWLLGVWGGGPVPVEIHYLLGEPPRATELDVIFARERNGESVARFESRLIVPDVVQHARLPAGPIHMSITLAGPGGARATVNREIHAERGQVVRLELAREVP